MADMEFKEESEARVAEFKGRATRGAIFEVAAFAIEQIVRFWKQPNLTRLLIPEHFGLMLFVNTFNVGLVMLSDVGIEQSVIQNKKGSEPQFYNTAWTLQVIRGGALYGVALLLAYPLAWIGDNASLLWFIPVSALTVLFAGLGSTSEYELRRRVEPKRILVLELVVQSVSIIAMIAIAYSTRSIWALIIGPVVREAVRTFATHFVLIPGHRNRFLMDAVHRSEIIRFGRWILGSSALFFFSGMSDRFIMLPLLGEFVLGVYSIALMLVEAVIMLVGKVIHGILMPLFARIDEEGRENLKEVYYQARLRTDSVAVGVGILVVVGPWFIEFAWDDRYHPAGWMLQILCLRALTRIFVLPADACLISIGQTKMSFFNNVARTVMIFVGIPLGYYLGGDDDGPAGVIWAVALADLPSLFILWPKLWSEKILQPKRELLPLLFLGVGLLVGYGILPLLEWIF